MDPNQIEEWRTRIQAGLDLNAPTSSGRTPLNDEIFAGRFDVARFLIDCGARLDLERQCPVVFASRHADPDFLRFLIEAGADVNGTDQFGGRALSVAVTARHLQNVLCLLQMGAVLDSRIVASAATTTFEIVKALVAAGGDVNCAEGSRYSPGSPLILALRFSKPEIASFLLDHGANPIVQDTDGLRPFHLARAKGYDELAARLAAAEPREWHDVEILKCRFSSLGLPTAILDFLGESNQRIDFTEVDGCITKFIIFNTIEEITDHEWEGYRVLDLMRTVENFYASGALCWFVDEKSLGTYDIEHRSWGLMKDLTIEEFLEAPARHMNAILQGAYTQFEEDFLDEEE